MKAICYLFVIIFLGFSSTSYSQDEHWFYIRANDTLFSPKFKKITDRLFYIGKDEKLNKVLKNYEISEFKKTYRKAKKKDLKKTFFVISDSDEMLNDLLENVPHLFNSGEVIEEEDMKIYEPNDYGLTSTIGENIGLQVNLDYLDFLGAPKAWYYTTGSRDVIIGMSDASIDTTDLDFVHKSKQIRKTTYANGHGADQASKAASQGDNAHGIPGICYDCSIYGTKYGEYKNLESLKELSDMGVKVINCSWVGRTYYDSAQTVIDEMFDNGTILVASAGNKSWKETKGDLKYYPASYDHVISVSSAMYKHENVSDNILQDSKGNYYSENVRGYIGRTMGFKNNDTLVPPHTWHVSTATLNPEVDLLAPTSGIFLHIKYLQNKNISYNKYETTSGASPFVSGTIGLMFSLSPCLPVDEVESILKITSLNIDDIEANKPYKGNYGAGMLNTGKAVKMVHDMYTEDATTFIEDQKFSRWDFKLTNYSKLVQIQNQKFTEDATFSLVAKNRIVIGENTHLKPNSNGKIHLRIDNSLEKPCDLIERKNK